MPFGAAVQANGTVRFRLWAPAADRVELDLPERGGARPMRPLEQGWHELALTAAPGEPYSFLLPDGRRVADPASRCQAGDALGPSLIVDPAAYRWRQEGWPGRPWHEAVVYELHVGTFTPQGTFRAAIERLPHLAELGVTALEIMPVADFVGRRNWGYDGVLPFAPDRSYGAPDDLKALIDTAHAHGLMVLLDVVHNHYGPSDLELYGFDTGSANRFYFYTNSGICCTPWGDRPNYANPGVRSFISDNFKMWLDEYHVDGFRWDAVGAMRQYDAGSGNYIAIPEADTLIQSINNTIVDGNAISIAEDAAFGTGFDGEWNSGFANTLINEIVKSTDASRDMNALSSAMTGSGFFRVLFSETHDLVGDLNGASHQRLPKRIDAANPASQSARKRSLLAAATVLTTPGIPMLFMGQEMLEDKQFSSSYALDWTRANTFSAVTNFYRDLIRLRRNLEGVSAGFTGPNLNWHVVRNDAPWKLLAFHRWGAGANDQVMVIMNFTSNAIPSYVINTWPADGNWFVNLNSDGTKYGGDFGNYGSSLVNVVGGSGGIAIGPYSVLVLSRQALPNLDSDGDGLLNGWEQQHFGDPLVAVATDDDDDDGANNLQEQAAGTNPNSAGSVLKFTDIHTSGTNVILRWIGGQSARQTVQQADSLSGPWTPLLTNLPPTSITNSLTISNAVNPARLYRLQASP